MHLLLKLVVWTIFALVNGANFTVSNSTYERPLDGCCTWNGKTCQTTPGQYCNEKDHCINECNGQWINDGPSPTPTPASSDAFQNPDYTKTSPPLTLQTKAWPDWGGNDIVAVKLENETIGKPTQYHYGINLPVYAEKDYINSLAEQIIEGGFKQIRFPGGSPADNYIWNCDYNTFPFFKKWDYMCADSKMNTDDVIALARKTDCELIIQINFAAFIVNGPEQATKLAVDWLKYFQSKNFPIKYWSFGNENYGNWETPTSNNYKFSGDDYGKHLKTVSSALKAVDPDIFVGGVVFDQEESWMPSLQKTWMQGVVPHMKGAADYAIYHSYFLSTMDYSSGSGVYNLPSSSELYNADGSPAVQKYRSAVEGLMNKYSPGFNLPIAMTEWNIDFTIPHADTPVNEHISALITGDILGQTMNSNSGMPASHYFALADAFRSTGAESQHNPGPGDLALIAHGDSSTADGTPRPAWYAYALYKLAMGDRMVKATTSDNDVTVYASTFAKGDGKVGLIVINRKSSSAKLALGGIESLMSSVSEIRGWVVTSSDSSKAERSRGSKFNGVSSSNSVGGPFPISNIKALTMTSGYISLPASSISGIVVY